MPDTEQEAGERQFFVALANLLLPKVLCFDKHFSSNLVIVETSLEILQSHHQHA